MKITIKFAMGHESDEHTLSDISEELVELEKKLSKYKIKLTMLHYTMYKIEQDNPLYLEAVSLYKKYSQDFVLWVFSMYPEFTSDEMEAACAYVPNFCDNYVFQDFDEFFRCPKCTLELVDNREFQIEWKGFASKNVKKYATFCLEHEKNVNMITKPLYDHLIQNGISSEYFKAIKSKSGKHVVYTFYSDHILKSHSFHDEEFEPKGICAHCKKEKMVEIEYPFFYVNKYLDASEIDSLKQVNFSKEYYNGDTRKVIVNKDVYRLIKEKVKKACFLPVYIKE